MMATDLDDYLERKGIVITNPHYKAELEIGLMMGLRKPGEDDDAYIERIMRYNKEILLEKGTNDK